MKIGYLMQAGEDIRKPPFNGPAMHVRQVILELQRKGHIVCVLYRWDGTIYKSDDLVTFTPIVVARIDRGPLRLLERFIRRVQFELKLPYLAFFESLRFALACAQELSGFDLYLERVSWMAYGGVMAASWEHIPIVLEYNGDPLADLEAKGIAPHGLQLKISSSIYQRSLNSAAHVVASGQGWRQNCIDRWVVPPERVTVIENGTELVNILSREQLRSFQTQNDLDRPFVVIYLGGFLPWHGLDILVQAISKVVVSGCEVRLRLIGSGDGEQEIRNLVSELGLNEQVEFLGSMSASEFANCLSDADIGVSPYCGWSEYSGLKLFDYKAAGLPTIASGENDQPRTLKHGETGWIVPPCDVDRLAEAIIFLCANPDLRFKMGQTARQEAEKIHGWDETARQMEQIFQMVLTR